MSTFFKSFSKIHFPSQCILRMLIRHFSHSPFKFSSQEVVHNKGLPKKIAKLTESIDGGVSFSIKLKVVGWKETPVHVHSCEFCKILKNNYLFVNVGYSASGILGYPYIGISSARSTLKQCIVFSNILILFISTLANLSWKFQIGTWTMEKTLQGQPKCFELIESK